MFRGPRVPQGAGEGKRGRGGTWEEPAGQAPPPTRDQSTAEKRAHARITAQALAETAGLPPTSGRAQRLPIAPLLSEANRREHFPLPVRGYHGGGCARERLRVPARREGRGERAEGEPRLPAPAQSQSAAAAERLAPRLGCHVPAL